MKNIVKKFSFILLVFLIMFLFACKANTSDEKTITIACSKAPHADILNEIVPSMKKRGFNLIIKECADYETPNILLNDGEVDANYFQCEPFLNDYNDEHGTDIVCAIKVHYEPFGIYAGMSDSLKLQEGIRIVIPNDKVNVARAQNLLEKAGIIDNEIIELDPSQISRVRESVSLVCMNGNYAIEAGFNAKDALFLEEQNKDMMNLYANAICVKKGNENADFIVALKECFKDHKIKSSIEEKYEGSVVFVN